MVEEGMKIASFRRLLLAPSSSMYWSEFFVPNRYFTAPHHLA